MRKVIFMFVFLLILIASTNSCRKDEQHINPNILCGIKDPLNNIEWLNKLVNRTESSTDELELYKVVWKEQDYILKIVMNASDFGWQLFDCTGNLFCYVGGLTTYTNCDLDLYHQIENNKNMVLVYAHYAD